MASLEHFPRSLLCAIGLIALGGCGGASSSIPQAPREPRSTRITLIGTNDLHGRLEALPLLAGYLANLRENSEVVLVDGGDMFQGTLESNLSEGATVVRAYSLLDYDAVTIGNHEFDYGPAGPTVMPGEGDDPRGALRARIAEADYPFLAANLRLAENGERVDLGQASVLIEKAGVPIGLIGVTTEDTLTTTLPAAVSDLRMEALTSAIERESAQLRGEGAVLVFVLAHAGGECARFDDPEDLSSCESDAEIMRVAESLESESVDAIVGGHTHQGVAHRVNGIPVIESFANGFAFGRIDFEVRGNRVLASRIHPPRGLCGPTTTAQSDLTRCDPGGYEGAPVSRVASVQEVVDEAGLDAQSLRQRTLEVELAEPFTRTYRSESALGNLFVDLLLSGYPEADVSMVNAGGLREDMPAGPVRYGAIYEMFPFDNRVVILQLTGAELSRVIAANLQHDRGFFSFGGIEAQASCGENGLQVSLTRRDGTPIGEQESLSLLTSDYLVSGGDHAFDVLESTDARTHFESTIMRELIWNELASRGAESLEVSRYYDEADPRIRYPASRPVSCP